MKGFNRIITAAVIIMAAFIVVLDAVMLKSEKLSQPLYKVEVSRIERELSQGTQVSAEDYPHITGIYSYDRSPDFYSSDGEYLIREIDGIIENLQQYSAALKARDEKTLRQLLKDGRECKERIDGEYND